MPAPDEDLTDRLKFGEFAEYQCYGLLNAPVWILLNMVTAGLYKTDCDGEEKPAPARLLLHRLDRALPKYREFHLAHRALHAERKSIVGRGGIVDAVFIARVEKVTTALSIALSIDHPGWN